MAEPDDQDLNRWERLEKDREQPADAMYYDGFWLRLDEIERLIEIQLFHQKYGDEKQFIAKDSKK